MSGNRERARHVASGALFAVCLASASAGAQSTEADRIVRRQLIEQATEAQTAGRTREALSLAQRAEAIEATAGTRLLVAQLREQLGQHVEALSSVELCLREVDHDTQTTARNRAAIRERCEALQREVRTHVGTLVVEVPSEAPGDLRVTVNGAELPAALYGIARPVVVGDAEVIVRVAGGASHTDRVTVTASAPARLRVEVPRNEEAHTDARPTPPLVVTPQRDEPANTGSTRRTLGLVLGGVGVAMLGGAVVSGLMFQSTYSDYEQQRCADIPPIAACQDQYDRLEALNIASWVGYVGGGVLAATGVVLFVTAPRSQRREQSLRCGLGPGTVGVACDVRF